MIGLRGHHVRGAAVAAGLVACLTLAGEPMPTRVDGPLGAASTAAEPRTPVKGAGLSSESMLRDARCSDAFIRDFARGAEDQKQAMRDGLVCMRAYLAAKRVRAEASIGTKSGEVRDAAVEGGAASVNSSVVPRSPELERLRAAGCPEEFIAAFEAERADRWLARKSGLRCLSAFMSVADDVTPQRPAGARIAQGAAAAVRGRLLDLYCYDAAAALQKDPGSAARMIASGRNPDCGILAAFALRERGLPSDADSLAGELIRLYTDPVKPTYPLMLYYKVAYLDGGARELGELARQPNGSALGAEARAEMLRSLEAQVAGFLKNPQTVRPCPDLSARLPSDDPLRASVERVCMAIEHWESALAATGLSGQAWVTGLEGALTELAGAYPVNVLGRSFEAPFWVSREARPWLDCAGAFYEAFDRANNLADTRQLQMRWTALMESMKASRQCPQSTQIAHRLPVEAVRSQLAQVEGDIEAGQRSGGVLEGLQRRILDQVGRDGPRAARFLPDWLDEVRALPRGSPPLDKEVQRLLDRLGEVLRCWNITSLGPGEELAEECRSLGAGLDSTGDPGRRSVTYDHTQARNALDELLESARSAVGLSAWGVEGADEASGASVNTDASIARPEVRNPIDIRAGELGRGARDALQRRIAETVERDGLKALPDLTQWRREETALPKGIALEPEYERLLRLMEQFRMCRNKFSQLPQTTMLPDACWQFGAKTRDQNGGVRWVDYDRATAERLVKQALGRVTSATQATDRANQGAQDRTRDLSEVFAHLWSARVLGATGIRGNVQSFKNTVEATFREAGLDLQCISEETWSAIQPEVAWTWIAFSDCRLQEDYYGDAAENLDIAARYLTTAGPNHPLRRLALERLSALAAAADGYGAADQVRRKLGLRDTSSWLADAFDDLKAVTNAADSSDSGRPETAECGWGCGPWGAETRATSE